MSSFFIHIYIFSCENAPILHRCAHKFHLFTVILMVFIFFVHLLFFKKVLSHVNMGNEISRLVLKSIKTMSILVELIKNFPFHKKKKTEQNLALKTVIREREREREK